MKEVQSNKYDPEQQIQQQFGASSQMKDLKLSIAYKTLIALILILGFTCYRIFFKEDVLICQIDMIHQWTHPINRWLDEGAWVTVLAVGQFITDGAVVFIIIFWLGFVKNIRHPSTIGLFFLVRALFLNVQKFPFPDDMVWRSPGIPNLTVPYQHTRDFFYSGHTGTVMSVFLEMYNTKMTKLTIILGLAAAYIIPFLLITRVHYTIDVLAALVFLLYINQFVKKHLFYFDYFFNLPYTFIRWIYQVTCKGKDKQIQMQI